MAASHYKLSNLIGIIDANGLQITGKTTTVLNNEPLADKWRSFGWEVVEIDGNDMESIVGALTNCPINTQKPTVIIAHTVKGKGVPFAENQVGWHHRVPTEQELFKAVTHLQAQIESLTGGQSYEYNTK
jgi:transketolase